MIRKSRMTIAVGWVLASVSVAGAQQLGPVPASAQAQMKPLGAPSAVDRYRSPAHSIDSRQRNDSRQWVETQSQIRSAQFSSVTNSGPATNVQPAQFTLPPSSQPMTAPPGASSPPPANLSAPPTNLSAPPASLPVPPTGVTSPSTSLPMPPSLGGQPMGDLTPLPQPRLGDVPFGGVSAGPGSNGFATLNNCSQVSGPSGYSAALYSSPGGCAPVGYQAPLATSGILPTNPFAGQGSPPAGVPLDSQGFPTAPPGAPLGAVASGNTSAPAGALLSFGQEAYPVQVGQGILGQPKAYVPGQAVRNWLRYLTP